MGWNISLLSINANTRFKESHHSCGTAFDTYVFGRFGKEGEREIMAACGINELVAPGRSGLLRAPGRVMWIATCTAKDH